MKVVDPQSALLTNAEVYEFLKSYKARPADKKIGAYEPVKLDDHKRVCADVRVANVSSLAGVSEGLLISITGTKIRDRILTSHGDLPQSRHLHE